MPTLSPIQNASLELVALAPTGITPGGLAQHKLSRLLELRGVIDSLHCERQARDPLPSWVLERERASIQPGA